MHNLPLTPDRLSGIYEMLRGWPPFSRWRLPSCDQVGFHVARTHRWHAAWWFQDGKHHVEVSQRTHAHLLSVVPSMAHEMIHIRQRISKTETKGVEHNAEYRRLARVVCHRLGFDYGQFFG